MRTQTFLLILNTIKCKLISVRNVNFISIIEILFGNSEIYLTTFMTENCINEVIIHIYILKL